MGDMNNDALLFALANTQAEVEAQTLSETMAEVKA